MTNFNANYTPLYEIIDDLKKIDSTFYVVYDANSDKTQLIIRNLMFIGNSHADVVVKAWKYYYERSDH